MKKVSICVVRGSNGIDEKYHCTPVHECMRSQFIDALRREVVDHRKLTVDEKMDILEDINNYDDGVKTIANCVKPDVKSLHTFIYEFTDCGIDKDSFTFTDVSPEDQEVIMSFLIEDCHKREDFDEPNIIEAFSYLEVTIHCTDFISPYKFNDLYLTEDGLTEQQDADYGLDQSYTMVITGTRAVEYCSCSHCKGH